MPDITIPPNLMPVKLMAVPFAAWSAHKEDYDLPTAGERLSAGDRVVLVWIDAVTVWRDGVEGLSLPLGAWPIGVVFENAAKGAPVKVAARVIFDQDYFYVRDVWVIEKETPEVRDDRAT